MTVAMEPLSSPLQSWHGTWLVSTAAGYTTRLYAGFYLISILAAVWVFFVARRLPPGRWRALACLPVVLLQLAATPLLVDRTRTAVLIVPVCGTFSLAAFKASAAAKCAVCALRWTQHQHGLRGCGLTESSAAYDCNRSDWQWDCCACCHPMDDTLQQWLMRLLAL